MFDGTVGHAASEFARNKLLPHMLASQVRPAQRAGGVTASHPQPVRAARPQPMRTFLKTATAASLTSDAALHKALREAIGCVSGAMP